MKLKKPAYVVIGILVAAAVLFVYAREGIISFDFNFGSDSAEQEKRDGGSTEIVEGEPPGVSSNHPLAVEVGNKILSEGGNAVDAAVAVSYVLGVVEPYGSGLGGGGEMVIAFADEKVDPVSYQYKEAVAESGGVPKSYTGVPGMVKGLEMVHNDYGNLQFKDLIQPAIDLAEKGFQVDELLAERIEKARGRVRGEGIDHFYPKGKPISAGAPLKQLELAETLKLIQEDGAEAFYSEEIADRLIAHTGHIQKADMEAYEPVKTEPVHGEFMGYDIYAASAPLSGVTFVQILQMVEVLNEQEPLKDPAEVTVEEQADYIHLISEISKLAYKDRHDHIGDPKMNEEMEAEVARLTSRAHAEELVDSIEFDSVTPGEADDSIGAEQGEDPEDTTHFVIVDEDGMIVSATHTLGDFFGSGDYVAGFFLNDTLKNFSTWERSPNTQEPGKVPRSFISPAILIGDDEAFGIGTPGGTRIPMTLSQVIIQKVLFEKDMQTAIEAPLFFVEDDVITVEEEISEEVRDELRERGYTVKESNSESYFGGVQALGVDESGGLFGGADNKRRNGTWAPAGGE